jgi:hypothetical protein
MTKITHLAMLLGVMLSLSLAGGARAHWHQPLSWTHRSWGHHDDSHHHHHGCGCWGLFSLFTRHVVVHHHYPPPVYCAPPLYPRPTAGREEPREVLMEEEEWTGKDKKHSGHRRRGAGGTGTTD